MVIDYHPASLMAQTLLSTPITLKPRGSTLLALRKSVENRTQKDVERDTGVSMLRLSLYERGNPIPVDHLEALAHYYKFPPTELVEPDSLAEVLIKLDIACRVLNHTPSIQRNGGAS